MAEGLRLLLLGRPRIIRGGAPVTGFVSNKAQALLCYLAVTGRSHSREALAGLLWGDMPEADARNNLRVVLSNLRRLVGPHLVITRRAVAFNRQTPYWLDVEAFSQRVNEAMRQRGDEATRRQGDSLTEAVRLYRGDFLEGFHVRDAVAFEDWALGQRERLRQLMLQALHKLAVYHTTRGMYTAAMDYTTRLLALEPWQEEAHQQLMLLLALTGRRSEALEQYARCRRLLAQELGVEPMPETAALYERIRDGEESPHLPISPSPHLPFVGREEEHAQLIATWEQARRGQGRLTLIEGEAGIGKTRLAEEVLRYIEAQGDTLLRGRCYEFGATVAYQPIAEALRSVLSRGAEEQRGRGAVVSPAPLLPCSLAPIWLAELSRLLPELRDLVPDLPPPIQVSGEAARQRLFEAVARFLQATVSGRSSAVIFLDDLHWADPATLDLVHYLLHHLSPAPVWILGTYRPEEVSFSHPLTRLRQGLSRDHLVTRLILKPLSESAVQVIAREITSTESEALGHYLYRESTGNPFIMAELIQTLKDLGLLEADRPHAWSDPRFASLLPAAVQDVILQRVGRLSPSARRLLTLAAVYGRDFDHNLLQALAGYDTAQVDACLEEWLLRHLVQPQGRGGGGFDFSHDKIRAAVYEDVEPERRRALHRRVGETLERLHPHLATAPAALLAHHWQAAGHQTKALPYLLRAGDQARLLYAHEQAIDYYRQALAILRDQDQDEQAAHTLMKLGLTHHSAFDFPQARAAYDQAFVLWQSVNAPPSSVSLESAPRPLRVRWLEPNTLDPALASDTHTNGLLAHLFSGLVELTPTMNVAPDVARAWEISDAGRRFIFHLREDVHWSDGVPVTAQDFESAWKRLLDPALASRVAVFLFDLKGAQAFHQGEGSADDVGVQAVDAHTLAVELERPTGYFLQLLTHVAWFPVPHHVVEAHGPAWADPAHFVSNGPFRLHAWQRGQSLVLRRNPRYHGRFSGNLQEVELLQIPDWSRRHEMYEAGELDVLGIAFFPAAAFEEARLQHAEEYVSLPWLETHFLAFDVTRPPFDDVRVRRAFVLATDRNALADEVLQGRVSPATGGLTPPGMSGYTPDIALPFDPDGARRLLAEAGYCAGCGFPPVELLAYDAVALRNRYLQHIWTDILGVEVRLETVAWPEYAARLGKTPHHIVNLSWVADYPDPDNFLRLSRAKAWPGWQDEAYERLVQMASQSLQPAQRLRLYARAEQRLVDEAPILPLLYERDHLLIKPWVTRYPVSAIRPIFWKDAVLDRALTCPPLAGRNLSTNHALRLRSCS